MNLKEYQIEANRTCPNIGSDAVNLSHMALGMFSEFSEMVDSVETGDRINIAEEVADFYWYLANYCTIRNYDLSFINENKVVIDGFECNDFFYNISILQDFVKKYLAYGKEINKEEEVWVIQCLMDNIDEMFIDSFDIDLELSLQNNIDKLKIRYPDKFTKENAINRNLDAERIELEKE